MITLLLLVRVTYICHAVLRAHPVRVELNIQRYASGEVATALIKPLFLRYKN